MEKLDLENGKISSLIKKFAIPCVIFIGWSDAGAFENAATNIVYPFTVIALAVALLVGDGAAALFSLSLGAKEKEKANKAIGNGLILLIIISIILTLLGIIFSRQILTIFGGNPKEIECYEYAKCYLRIIWDFLFILLVRGSMLP